jgi:hypothetical protein
VGLALCAGEAGRWPEIQNILLNELELKPLKKRKELYYDIGRSLKKKYGE